MQSPKFHWIWTKPQPVENFKVIQRSKFHWIWTNLTMHLEMFRIGKQRSHVLGKL